jgi:rubredoxin
MTGGPAGEQRQQRTAVRAAPVGIARIERFYSNVPTSGTSMKKYICLICGWIYDEAAGAPEEGIAPGTKWEDVPPNWSCPECGARKEDFEMVEF